MSAMIGIIKEGSTQEKNVLAMKMFSVIVEEPKLATVRTTADVIMTMPTVFVLPSSI